MPVDERSVKDRIKDRFIRAVSDQAWEAFLDFSDSAALRQMARWLAAEQVKPENCDHKWFDDTIADLNAEIKRRNAEASIEGGQG